MKQTGMGSKPTICGENNPEQLHDGAVEKWENLIISCEKV